MPTLTRFSPQAESELHLLILNELEALEEGLVLLQHEYPTSSGIIDFLCADSGGRLVIIEVKLHEDDNILFQALRYFSAVDRDRYLIASALSGRRINPDEAPRIVLVAERFSDDLRRLSTLIVPDVEFYEYSTVILPDARKGILFHPVSLPLPIAPPAEPRNFEDLISYLKSEELKPVVEEARQQLKGLGKAIEEYATRGYIGYKHSGGRQFAYIKIHRQSIDVGAHVIDEDKALLDYQSVRIESPGEDYSEVLAKARTSFANLGGRVAE